jgi:hypothetical protein
VPSLHALRASYRSGWGSVAVEYTRDVTEAYLLAYYPHYVGMARSVVNLLPPHSFPRQGTMRVCAFGTGPAPEPVAIARYLRDHLPDADTLELYLFDINPEAWDWARGVSLERVLPQHWSGDVDVRVVDRVDIASARLIDGSVAEATATADLVVFQNCLNELATKDAHVRENARELVAAMKPGAVLTMADIDNYPTARRCLEIIEQTIDGEVHWLHRFDEALHLDVMPGLPNIVRNNLFLQGEYPRSNPFPWRCLAAQRRA